MCTLSVYLFWHLVNPPSLDIRRQLGDHLGCLELRMESKLSLLAEFQEFFKRRGEVEYEYARSLERLCERFERNTKQRNLRYISSFFVSWLTVNTF